MKYMHTQKQNQRILEITDSTLVVWDEIVKETHVARAIDFHGIELGKELVFQNHRQGLVDLVSWMKVLQERHAARYRTNWTLLVSVSRFPAVRRHLSRCGQSSSCQQTKEIEDNSQTKNDYKDAKVITDRVRNGKYSKPKLPKAVYADLRILMNLREKVMVNLGQVQRKCLRFQV